MTSTVFYDEVPATPATPATPIVASWLNDVNAMVYGGGGGSVDPITQTGTGYFFTYDPVKINRLNDRVFIGGATVDDGTAPNIVQNWFTEYQIATGRTNGFSQFAQVVALTTSNHNSANAVVAAAHTGTLTGTGNSIGYIGVGVNDGTAYNTNAYGFYGEAFNAPGALGGAYAMELDTVNYQGAASITPYAQTSKQVIALQLAAGAELSPTGQYSSSAAINIWNNGSNFERGINFGSTSIAGATGTSGTGIAIAFGQGHTMQWFGSDSAPTSSIFCSIEALDAANAISIQFAANGMRLQMPGGQTVANFIPIPTASNYLQFVPATAGNSVQIQAQGSDTNVHLSLVPKGTGRVQFGAYTGGAPAATGYITILDNTGVPRKILVG